MKGNGVLIILSILCFQSLWLYAQTSKDTIYIYETVEIYDTVFVYDTVYRNIEIDKIKPKNITYSLLQLDTTNKKANLIVISDQQTATLPIRSISINENIKIDDDMKKIKFLGLIMIAAKSMLFAQTEIGITVGTGTWWQSSTKEFVESPPIAPLISTGLFVRQPIIQNNFALKLEANFAFLQSTGKYVYGEEGSKYHQLLYEYNDGITYASTSFIDLNERYGNNLWNLTIPISIIWNKNKLRPLLGFNYYFLHYNTNKFRAAQGLGLQFGLAYKITDKLSIDSRYYFKGHDYGEGGKSIAGDKILLSEYLHMRNNQIRLSFCYTFGNKEQEEIKEP